MPHIISASQNSSYEVNGHGKILSTSFGSGIAVGDHLSSASETHLSKNKTEVLIIGMCLEALLNRLTYNFNTYVEDGDNQLNLTALRKSEESEIKQHGFEVEEKLLVEDNLDVRISITEDVKMFNEVEDGAIVVERNTTAKPAGTTK